MNTILQKRIKEAATFLFKQRGLDKESCRQAMSYILAKQWISVEEALPEETKYESDTRQGHKEWTESDGVLVLDSLYGVMIDSTKNGRWRSETERSGYQGQLIHGITHWMPIPPLEGGEK